MSLHYLSYIGWLVNLWYGELHPFCRMHRVRPWGSLWYFQRVSVTTFWFCYQVQFIYSRSTTSLLCEIQMRYLLDSFQFSYFFSFIGQYQMFLALLKLTCTFPICFLHEKILRINHKVEHLLVVLVEFIIKYDEDAQQTNFAKKRNYFTNDWNISNIPNAKTGSLDSLDKSKSTSLNELHSSILTDVQHSETMSHLSLIKFLLFLASYTYSKLEKTIKTIKILFKLEFILNVKRFA